MLTFEKYRFWNVFGAVISDKRKTEQKTDQKTDMKSWNSFFIIPGDDLRGDLRRDI